MTNWRTGSVRRVDVYCLREADLDSVGHCWMKGRLRAGDLVTPIEHTGDCFWTYQLLEGGSWLRIGGRGPEVEAASAYRLCNGGTFGAYVMGVPHDEQPTSREWHLLMAGETVNFTRKKSEQDSVPAVKGTPTWVRLLNEIDHWKERIAEIRAFARAHDDEAAHALESDLQLEFIRRHAESNDPVAKVLFELSKDTFSRHKA